MIGHIVGSKNKQFRQWASEVLSMVKQDLPPIRVVLDSNIEINIMVEEIAFYADPTRADPPLPIQEQIRLFTYNIGNLASAYKIVYGNSPEQVFKFIFAHEIGHYVLNKTNADDNDETNADQFAADLLGYRIAH